MEVWRVRGLEVWRFGGLVDWDCLTQRGREAEGAEGIGEVRLLTGNSRAAVVESGIAKVWMG